LPVKVTAEAARRFLVARHFLAPARSVAGGLDGVLEVFGKFGSIQFDPIAVAGRNHDLVLHARVAGYEPAWCDVRGKRYVLAEELALLQAPPSPACALRARTDCSGYPVSHPRNGCSSPARDRDPRT
jgi:uncharacterized protein YcaQ